MGINKIYLLVCFMIFSVTCAWGTERTDSLYKVLKIKVLGNYYVIHARRNDSLFKIISKKVLLNNTQNLLLVKTGQCYYFDFGKEETGAKDEIGAITGIVNNLDVKNNHVFVDGNARIKFTKRFHYRIYTTRNLIGLYYSYPTSVSSP